MKRIYVEKEKASQALEEISRIQQRRNEFINVTIKEYHGKKFDPATTAVIVIG